MRFILDVTPNNGADAVVLADQLLDYLCDGGAGTVEYPSLIHSVDGCDPDAMITAGLVYSADDDDWVAGRRH